jgi:hypothetical protein
MFKIVSLLSLSAGLFLAASPVAAASGSNCGYAITKLQAQIKYEQGIKNTAAASAAAAEALAWDAKAEAAKGKGASADAAQSDAACRKAVIKGWTALHG